MMKSKIRDIALVLLIISAAIVSPTVSSASERMSTELLSFEVNGLKLSGMLDTPTNGPAHALVIFVHGYGETNVIKQNWYLDLRTRFADLGISSFVWDKPGCGDSEGEFDADQPVDSSATEVVAAAAFLREIDAPGSHKIGLWGISRAGWVAPLALSQDKRLAFWISVSGVDSKESFGYLLASNWRIDGYSEDRIDHLLAQWHRGNELVAGNGAYNEFLSATIDYRADELVRTIYGDDDALSRASFEGLQAKWEAMAPSIDPESGLMIYVEDFDSLLSELDISVLALFGEKDSIVDWRSTKALYEATVGSNPNASLTIETFPNGNHNIHQSETGSFKEMVSILNAPRMAPRYYDVVLRWLRDTVRN